MIGEFIVSYVARRIPKNFLVDSVDESCGDLVARSISIWSSGQLRQFRAHGQIDISNENPQNVV